MPAVVRPENPRPVMLSPSVGDEQDLVPRILVVGVFGGQVGLHLLHQLVVGLLPEHLPTGMSVCEPWLPLLCDHLPNLCYPLNTRT